MAFYKKITIKWSYPVAFDRILEKESVTDMGIYYISRQFGNKKSILYIGKTTDMFKHRLKDHKKKWLDTYRGQKSVRLGTVIAPVNISEEERKELINDAEKTIIYYLSKLDEHDPVANVVSTNSANFYHILKIENTGFRGQLPKEICIPKEWLKIEE